MERRSLDSVDDSPMDEDSGSEEEDDGTQEKSDEAASSDAQDAVMEEADQPTKATLAYETDAIFIVVDPTRQPLGGTSQELLSGASNIKLLRLFNDVSVAPCPPLPTAVPKRIKPGHRLIDEDGFQVCATILFMMMVELCTRRKFTQGQEFGYGINKVLKIRRFA